VAIGFLWQIHGFVAIGFLWQIGGFVAIGFLWQIGGFMAIPGVRPIRDGPDFDGSGRVRGFESGAANRGFSGGGYGCRTYCDPRLVANSTEKFDG
jgi:hypothetical protein